MLCRWPRDVSSGISASQPVAVHPVRPTAAMANSDAKLAVDLAQVLHAVPQLWEHLPMLARQSIAAVSTELREYCRLTAKDAFVTLSEANMTRRMVYSMASAACATSLQMHRHFSGNKLRAKLVFPPMPKLLTVTFGSTLISSSTLASIAKAKWPQLRALQLSLPDLNVTDLQLLFNADWPLLETLYLLDPAQAYRPYESEGSYFAELSGSGSSHNDSLGSCTSDQNTCRNLPGSNSSGVDLSAALDSLV